MIPPALEGGYVSMLPRPASSPSQRNWSETSHVVLDVDAAKVYREFSIEPESPAKGNFVQNKKFEQEKIS